MLMNYVMHKCQLNMMVWKSVRRCFGRCGWSGINIGYDTYEEHEKFKRIKGEGHTGGGGGGGDDSEEGGGGVNGTLVCVMPEKMAERMIGIHHNCGAKGKRGQMLAWRRWGYDDFEYNRTVHENPRKTVFPDW